MPHEDAQRRAVQAADGAQLAAAMTGSPRRGTKATGEAMGLSPPRWCQRSRRAGPLGAPHRTSGPPRQPFQGTATHRRIQQIMTPFPTIIDPVGQASWFRIYGPLRPRDLSANQRAVLADQLDALESHAGSVSIFSTTCSMPTPPPSSPPPPSSSTPPTALLVGAYRLRPADPSPFSFLAAIFPRSTGSVPCVHPPHRRFSRLAPPPPPPLSPPSLLPRVDDGLTRRRD